MSVTTPGGFRAAGVTAGLKASGRPDLALVVNDGPLDVAAGVFTTNRVEAAPVTWSRTAVGDGRARAVVLLLQDITPAPEPGSRCSLRLGAKSPRSGTPDQVRGDVLSGDDGW